MKLSIKKQKALEAACLASESEPTQLFKEFEIYMQIIDAIRSELFDIDGVGEAYNHLADSKRVVLVVDSLMADVNNGGFEQYYDNTTGNGAVYAPDCFYRIGMPKVAKVIEKANAVFPSPPAVSRSERENQIANLGKSAINKWSRLTNEYFKYSGPVTARNARYILDRSSEIFD